MFRIPEKEKIKINEYGLDDDSYSKLILFKKI
jgi:hypothetical protein